MDIGLDRFQHLRLQQHLLQTQPVEGVLLHDLDDRHGK